MLPPTLGPPGRTSRFVSCCRPADTAGGELVGAMPSAAESSVTAGKEYTSHDPTKASLREALPQGRPETLGRPTVPARPDQRARGGEPVAEGCGPKHGTAPVVRSRPGQMEALFGPLPEGASREEGRPQAAEEEVQRAYRHSGLRRAG